MIFLNKWHISFIFLDLFSAADIFPPTGFYCLFFSINVANSNIPGIVSHNTKQFIDSVLRYYKVQEFSPVIGRDGEGSRPFRRALPKTTLFEQALQHEGFYGLEPNEILCLGDEARDVEQANEVGFLSGACY